MKADDQMEKYFTKIAGKWKPPWFTDLTWKYNRLMCVYNDMQHSRNPKFYNVVAIFMIYW